MEKAPALETKLDLVKAEQVTDDLNRQLTAVKDMVLESVAELKDRKGSTLQAIKKKIDQNYMVNLKELNELIKKAILS